MVQILSKKLVNTLNISRSGITADGINVESFVNLFGELPENFRLKYQISPEL